MRIAKYVGQDYPTALHLLPQTTLDSLRKLCGPDDIGTYLEKQGIDLTFKLKDKSVTTFQEKVVQLLEKSADEKKSSSSSVPVKIFYLWLDTLEKKLEKSQARLNKNKTNILKKIVARLLEIIENYSE